MGKGAVQSFDDSNIEFLDEAERERYKEALTGEHFRDFLISAVGKHLHARAKQDVEEVKTVLLDLNPHKEEDRETWNRLQLKCGSAKNFLDWCAEAIINGDTAFQMLEDDED
jgi:5-methylcytosine-specific restriction endonuclease McrA